MSLPTNSKSNFVSGMHIGPFQSLFNLILCVWVHSVVHSHPQEIDGPYIGSTIADVVTLRNDYFATAASFFMHLV